MEGKRVKTSKNPILKRFRKTFSLENLVDASSDENANKVEGTSGDLKNNRKNQSTARNDNESMRGRCFSASSNLDGPNHQGALYLRVSYFSFLILIVWQTYIRRDVFEGFFKREVFSFTFSLIFDITSFYIQKRPSRGVLRKRCSENMQQIYRTPMPKHFRMGVLL